jgi:uridylate kinase
MALEIGQLVGIGVQVGLVIGGGNLFRGAALHAQAWTGSPAITWACWRP